MKKNPKMYILILLSFVLVISNACAENIQGQEALAISKMAGACGILSSMGYFQKTTKIPGGDEFIERFWAAEAARLGFSNQEYIDNCSKAIEIYDALWNAMESSR